jgi:hypothetical protein
MGMGKKESQNKRDQLRPIGTKGESRSHLKTQYLVVNHSEFLMQDLKSHNRTQDGKSNQTTRSTSL